MSENLENTLRENMRRFRTKNLDEQFGTSLGKGALPPQPKTIRYKKELQLDLSTVNVGDVLEAYETDLNKPVGRGTVVAVDNPGKRVELTDIEFLKTSFKTRGSQRGLNRVYAVGSNGKLNGFKKV